MTKANINPGICGLKTSVEIEKKEGKKYALSVKSDCEMVEKLAKEISELDFMDAFKRITENPVYRKGSTCLKHVSCPVPCAILKAFEVEAELALPGNVTIELIRQE